jgi:hypothetical protein
MLHQITRRTTFFVLLVMQHVTSLATYVTGIHFTVADYSVRQITLYYSHEPPIT